MATNLSSSSTRTWSSLQIVIVMAIRQWRTPSHSSHPTALGQRISQKENSLSLTAGIRTDRSALQPNTTSRIHQHLRQYLQCVDLQVSQTTLSQDWITMKCLVVDLESVCSLLRNLELLKSTSAHRNISLKTCLVLQWKQTRIREERHKCHIKLAGGSTFSSNQSRSHVTRMDLVKFKKRSTSQ